MFLFLSLATAGSFDTAALDTSSAEMDMAPCGGVSIDFLLPPDGAQGVSPAAVPAVSVNADCGSGQLLAVLTGPADQVQTSLVQANASGLIWFNDLVLQPDGNWLLDVQSGSGDEKKFYAYTGDTSSFSTGSAAITPLEGTPTLEILGSEFSAADGYATVSLSVHPIGGEGDPWQVLRGGAQLVTTGTGGDAEIVDGATAESGQAICYTLEQYTADGALAATSEQACVTVTGSVGGCGCTSTPGGASGALAVGLSMLAWRRRQPAGRA